MVLLCIWLRKANKLFSQKPAQLKVIPEFVLLKDYGATSSIIVMGDFL